MPAVPEAVLVLVHSQFAFALLKGLFCGPAQYKDARHFGQGYTWGIAEETPDPWGFLRKISLSSSPGILS